MTSGTESLFSDRTLADDLMHALSSQTGRTAYIGECFARSSGEVDGLPQPILGLGDFACGAFNTLQVGLSHRGILHHLWRSFWPIEGENRRVLAMQGTVGSCRPGRQARSDRPYGRVFRGMTRTAPKSTAGSKAAALSWRAPLTQAHRLFGGSLIRSASRAVSGTAGESGFSMSAQYSSTLETCRQVDFTFRRAVSV